MKHVEIHSLPFCSLVCSVFFRTPLLASSNSFCSVRLLLSTWLSTDSPSPIKNMLLNLLYSIMALSITSWLDLNLQICKNILQSSDSCSLFFCKWCAIAMDKQINGRTFSKNVINNTFFRVAMSSQCLWRCWVVTCSELNSSNACTHFLTS